MMSLALTCSSSGVLTIAVSGGLAFAFAYPMMGYAWGQYAADWLEGKDIPVLMQFNAIELNSAETIDEFEKAMGDVKETWKSADKYFTNLGNISYATRQNYLRVPG